MSSTPIKGSDPRAWASSTTRGEFAEVARPVIRNKGGQGVGAKAVAAAFAPEIGSFQEVLRQQGQFVEAVAERAEPEDQGRQGVIEVGPEPFGPERRVGVAGRGRDQADAAVEPRGQAGLQVAGEVEDVADQDGRPVRDRTAEQLSVEDFGRQRLTVVGEQRGLATRAVMVDRLSDQAFTGSPLANDQDRDERGGGGRHLVEQAAMGRPPADQGVEAVAKEEPVAGLHQLDAEFLGLGRRGERGLVGGPDQPEQAEQSPLRVVERPELDPPPEPRPIGVEDQGRRARRPAGDRLGRRAEAASEPGQVVGSGRTVGEALQAGHPVGGVAGQLLPGPIDRDDAPARAEEEDRLAGVLEQGIQAEARGAMGRHNQRPGRGTGQQVVNSRIRARNNSRTRRPGRGSDGCRSRHTRSAGAGTRGWPGWAGRSGAGR